MCNSQCHDSKLCVYHELLFTEKQHRNKNTYIRFQQANKRGIRWLFLGKSDANWQRRNEDGPAFVERMSNTLCSGDILFGVIIVGHSRAYVVVSLISALRLNKKAPKKETVDKKERGSANKPTWFAILWHRLSIFVIELRKICYISVV